MRGKRTVKIAGQAVGEGQPVFVIAEVGVNHNGSIPMAKKLIDAAVKAGADAVKFQMCDPDEMVAHDAPKAAYQEKTAKGESHYDMLKRLYFGPREHAVLKAYAQKKGIIFFSTPFSIADAKNLIQLGMPAFKVGSSDTNNHPQLRVIASAHKPVILSTGMSNLAEVKASLAVLHKAGARDVIILHCTTAYPTDDNDVNLRAMDTLATLGSPVGYSDHTPGTDVTIAAVARGACVIEKHITLDKKLPGPDHFASLEPDEFKKLVDAARRVRRILGDGRKEPTRGERVIAKVARKSIVAARDIAAGEKLTLNDFSYKRPGTGLPPSMADMLVGKRTQRAIHKDAQFTVANIA